MDILLGHLVGDYILQNDWMAKNKTNRYPQPYPEPVKTTLDDYARNTWDGREEKAWRQGHVACTVHCLVYTLSVWMFCFPWITWWGLLACYAVHWPVDRFRLARWWMEKVSGQKDFANGPLSPWSIIVVDNTFHLLTLFVIKLLCGVPIE